MVHAIILSKDRPAQVHLCVESIKKNASYIFPNISVLYKASNTNYQNGYEIVKKTFPDVSWVEESNYYNDVLELTDESFYLTSFFTDDDILYEYIPTDLDNIVNLFEEIDLIATLSLRLGLNTFIQDPYTHSHVIVPSSEFQSIENGKFIVWKWQDCPYYGNFGYPLSVDGHIFRTLELKKILSSCKFNNPNQQEVAMQTYINMLPPLMLAFRRSVLVNTPLNRVQETCLNRSGEIFGQKAEEMCVKYINGEKLDLNSIDFLDIIGCHQELDIKWTTK